MQAVVDLRGSIWVDIIFNSDRLSMLKEISALPGLTGIVALGVHCYALVLLAWLIVHLTLGDRWWWLFLINTFASYLFVLLPVMIVIGFWLGRGDVWLSTAVVSLIWLVLYGAYLLPPFTKDVSDAPRLCVMTFNAMTWNTGNQAETLAALRQSDADLIAIQELNLQLSEAIERELAELYPYRLLDPSASDQGMGILSRYPMRESAQRLGGAWIGDPQVVYVDVAGTQVTVINVHNVSFPAVLYGWRKAIEWSTIQREEQAQRLVHYVKEHPGPTIVVGDFNMGPRNRSYRLMREGFRDAWLEGGFGFGHTFPGGEATNMNLPFVGDIRVPAWLIRIDYIFHTAELQALRSDYGPWDTKSDHRPIRTVFGLKP